MRLQIVLVGLAVGLAAVSTRGLTQSTATPETILHRARAWAGEGPLRSVQSISVTVHRDTAREQYRLRWPDQFQRRVTLLESTFAETPPEMIRANTLDGNVFWQIGSVPREFAERARRGTTSSFVNVAVTFLLRLPTSLRVETKSLGSVNLGGIAGEGLLITDPTGKNTVFIFDGSTGQIRGYIDGTSPSGTMRGPNQHLVVRLSDHRDIGGIRFPFRAEEQWDALPGESPRSTTLIVDEILLNTLKSTDFKQSLK